MDTGVAITHNLLALAGWNEDAQVNTLDEWIADHHVLEKKTHHQISTGASTDSSRPCGGLFRC